MDNDELLRHVAELEQKLVQTNERLASLVEMTSVLSMAIRNQNQPYIPAHLFLQVLAILIARLHIAGLIEAQTIASELDLFVLMPPLPGEPTDEADSMLQWLAVGIQQHADMLARTWPFRNKSDADDQ